MEELKNQLIEKLGIEGDKADGAIEIVANFAKDKLPEGMQEYVDKALAGEDIDLGGMDMLKKGLGGFFGK